MEDYFENFLFHLNLIELENDLFDWDWISHRRRLPFDDSNLN